MDILSRIGFSKEGNEKGVTKGFTDKAADTDLFAINKYIEGLSEFIKICKTPMTISIQGSWGTGKTSIMNFIEKKLIGFGKIGIVKFNTWQFSQFNMEDQLAVSFISSMIRQIKLNPEESKTLDSMVCSLADLLGKNAKSIGSTAMSYVTSIASGGLIEKEEAKDFLNRLLANDTKDVASAISDLKNEFEKCIKLSLEKQNCERIVFFIDDLDRLEPRKAVELLEVMKLFFDVENCIFVLAIDYDVVVKGVADKYGRFFKGEKENLEKGKSFFDKIIQVPFKMPVGDYDIKNYVKQCFADIGVPCNNDDELDKYVALINSSVGNNPRSMKRLFNAFLLVTKIEPPEQLEKDKSKQLLFAVLCMQYSFEPFYNYLLRIREDITEAKLMQWANPEWDILQSESDADLSDIDIVKLKDFCQKFFDAVDYSVDGVSDKKISKEELQMLKNVLGVSSVTGSSQEQDADKQNAKQGKGKYSYLYKNDLYESGNRRKRNLGYLGLRIIADAAENLKWSKSDVIKFREAFFRKGGTGWLDQVVIVDNEVESLSSVQTDDEAYEGFRGVRKITCIPSFKHEFLSYMLTDNNNIYDEESAIADTETTVRLQDGICFVARYWDANYLERLGQVLHESFAYTTPLEKLNE